jgi:hypothetical protein
MNSNDVDEKNLGMSFYYMFSFFGTYRNVDNSLQKKMSVFNHNPKLVT